MDAIRLKDGQELAGSIVLKDNMLINIGEAYIVVNLLPEGINEEGPHHTLRLKIFGGANNGEIYEFTVDQMI
jgi:predicted ATPase with chaperone activity